MSSEARLSDLAAATDSTISVWMGSLEGRPWLRYAADLEHPAASTLKLPLLIAVHTAAERGTVRLDDRLDVHAEFDSVVGGASYVMTEDYDNDAQPWRLLGRQATVGWLAERAIVCSSNLATNLLLEHVGIATVNAIYERVGAATTRVRRGIQDDPASAAGIVNVATAAEMAGVLVGLLADRFTSPATTRGIEDILAASQTNDAMPAGLPEGTYVAHKPGWIDHACHDVGIVRPADTEPFVLAIYTATPLADPQAHQLVAQIAEVCWNARR